MGRAWLIDDSCVHDNSSALAGCSASLLTIRGADRGLPFNDSSQHPPPVAQRTISAEADILSRPVGENRQKLAREQT